MSGQNARDREESLTKQIAELKESNLKLMGFIKGINDDLLRGEISVDNFFKMKELIESDDNDNNTMQEM